MGGSTALGGSTVLWGQQGESTALGRKFSYEKHGSTVGPAAQFKDTKGAHGLKLPPEAHQTLLSSSSRNIKKNSSQAHRLVSLGPKCLPAAHRAAMTVA